MASMAERWKEFQPSKGFAFWSFAGGIVATLVVGFAVFGWYTAGGARALADNAAEESRTELASSICVERFMSEPDVAVQLAALKEESSWSRDTFIEDGGWTTFTGRSEEHTSELQSLMRNSYAVFCLKTKKRQDKKKK